MYASVLFFVSFRFFFPFFLPRSLFRWINLYFFFLFIHPSKKCKFLQLPAPLFLASMFLHASDFLLRPVCCAGASDPMLRWERMHSKSNHLQALH